MTNSSEIEFIERNNQSRGLIFVATGYSIAGLVELTSVVDIAIGDTIKEVAPKILFGIGVAAVSAVGHWAINRRNQ